MRRAASRTSAGTKQSGSGGHPDDDNLTAVAIEIPRLGFELALLGRVFGGLGNRAVDPRDLFADVEFGSSVTIPCSCGSVPTSRPIVELFGSEKSGAMDLRSLTAGNGGIAMAYAIGWASLIAKCSSGATEPLVEVLERQIESLRVGIQ